MGNLNLKAIFSADTKGFTVGIKQAKEGLRDFEKTSNSVVSGLGDAFGVNTLKVAQMVNAVRGLGMKLTESGNAGTAAFGKLITSITSAGAAMAGLGIGTAVAAFKALNAEAENFKNTVAGASIDMQTTAYLATYSQVMHDFNAETGKSIAEFESDWKKAFGRFKTNAKQTFVTGLTSNKISASTFLGPIAGSLIGSGQASMRDEATTKAEQAEVITKELFDLSRQLAAKSVEWAEADAKIAEYRRVMRDDTYSLAEKQNALAEVQALINSRYDEEYTIRKKTADLQTELVGLAGSSVEEEDQMYAAQKASQDVMRNKETMLKSLSRESKTLTNAAQAEAAARKAAAEAAAQEHQAILSARDAMLGTNLSVSDSAAAGIQGSATTMEIGAVIKPTYDPKDILDISEEIAGLVEEGIASMSESIGGLIGDLVTGGDAWSNFASSAIGAFGDMAISVGKMAISTGVATLGIKAALESLNGAVAIAAGVALVALGTAVKSGLSNVASGNYSASTSVASGSYATASASGGYGTSSLNINVTGTLRGEGSSLVAVINNENKRKNSAS